MITQDELKEYLNYNPDTGIFTWIKRSGDRINIGDIAGCLKKVNSYRIIRISKIYYAHRLAWLYMTGEFPIEQIDHINGIKDDNRFLNLRSVSNKENSKNIKLPTNNTSGVIGVYWDKNKKKWDAKIKVNQKTINLGRFYNKEDAVKVRKQAELEYQFHKNHGRLV